MQLPSSLSARVLISVVAVPLVLQMGCLAGLFYVQVKQEQDLDRSVHARDIAQALMRIRTDMYAIVLRFGSDQAVKVHFDQTAGEYESKVMGDYDRLQRLTAKADPALRAAIEESRSEARKGFDAVSEIKHAWDVAPEDQLGRIRMWARVRQHVMNVLNSDFDQYLQKQDEVEQKDMEARSGYHKMMVLFLSFLAASILLLAVFSSLYLVRGITMRIGRVSDNAYRLAANRPLNTVLSGDDEIARLDQIFHRMARTLKEAEAMKQEVVAMVTHDLRTPLATLRSILSALRSGKHGALDTKGSEYVRMAGRNVERMANLVDDLLDVEKVRSGLMTLDIQGLEIADCLTAAAELSLGLADELGVIIKLSPSDFVVHADQERVTRVLANLIGNAVKFSPPGGTVHVRCRQEGTWVYTSVSDQGPGIPEDKLANIFERFFQVEGGEARGRGGSGLGLAICQAIVKLHGGEIWAENLADGGSLFTFTLPAA